MSKTSTWTSCGGSRGITLVETIVSAFIVSLVAISIVMIFAQTLDMSRRIDYEYAATNLAKSRIERAKAVVESSGFDALPDLEETDSVLDSAGVPDSAGDFRRSTSVVVNYNGNTRLTSVDVTVVYRYRARWRDASAAEMTTVFTNVR